MTEETIDTPAQTAKPQRARISRNALILLAALFALGAALVIVPSLYLIFPFVLCGWLVSVVVHEFGHAYAGYRAGDVTVAQKGYLSFDPLKYTDLSTSLVVPILALALGGIGFPGGAVYLREDLMRSRHGRALASLAGPLGTLACLLVFGAAFFAADAVGFRYLAAALAFLAFLQATALILNLLPIPGLDGFGVIRPYLPKAARRATNRIGGVVGLILLGAIFFLPGASDDLFQAAVSITDLVGLPRDAIGAGYDAFTFWN